MERDDVDVVIRPGVGIGCVYNAAAPVLRAEYFARQAPSMYNRQRCYVFSEPWRLAVDGGGRGVGGYPADLYAASPEPPLTRFRNITITTLPRILSARVTGVIKSTQTNPC